MKNFIVLLLVTEAFSFENLSFDEWRSVYSVEFRNLLDRNLYEKNFLNKKAEIELHNANPLHTYKKALNLFAHMDNKEFIDSRCKTVLPDHLKKIVLMDRLNSAFPITSTTKLSSASTSQLSTFTQSSTTTVKSSTSSTRSSTTTIKSSTSLTRSSTTVKPSTSSTRSSTTVKYSTTKPFTLISTTQHITTKKSYVYPFGSYTASNAPKLVDFRYLMGPVQDQGNCGSCWAFATMNQIEGILKIRNPSYNTSLAPQYLIDCDTYDKGCEGGWPTAAMYFLKSPTGGNNAAPSMANYPYTAVKSKCKPGVVKLPLGINAITEKYYQGDEAELKAHIANYGPTVVAIFATSNFISYGSGVLFDTTCPSGRRDCDNVNHAVIITGFGTDPVYGDYWQVKNSWSSYWGEGGYIRMARNRNNNCNIACWAFHSS